MENLHNLANRVGVPLASGYQRTKQSALEADARSFWPKSSEQELLAIWREIDPSAQLGWVRLTDRPGSPAGRPYRTHLTWEPYHGVFESFEVTRPGEWVRVLFGRVDCSPVSMFFIDGWSDDPDGESVNSYVRIDS